VALATCARFGIPERIVSDNGPQYTSEAWKDFCRHYDIEHVTSSPHNPQANGHAERAVQLAKRILKQDDPVLALMCYRATPTTSTGVSPAELLMGRKIRTTLPSLTSNLVPKWPDKDLIRRRDAEAKRQQAFYFNKRHGVRVLPQLQRGDNVMLKLDEERTWTGPASVIQKSCTQRSYQVSSPRGGEMRRNRRHIQRVPPATTVNTETIGLGTGHSRADNQHQNSSQGQCENNGHDRSTPGQVVTRSGRVCKPVVRLDL
uniref:Integrase catalytic domain-containing protein n=1 Tax=Myripristis murdjan TaxID=586833 RepID=A0A667ZJL9_9TELE